MLNRVLPASRTMLRAFSTSSPAKDVSKLTLIGRLGADPEKKTSSNGKDYYQYRIATAAPAGKDAEGKPAYTTSWHSIFAFNENQHAALEKAGKGSLVYVEAELEMRKSDPVGDQYVPDRVLLRQGIFRVLSRVKTEGEAEMAE